jgi:hypothetical protein
VSPVPVATTEFASLYSKLTSSDSNESDGNPSAICQRRFEIYRTPSSPTSIVRMICMEHPLFE